MFVGPDIVFSAYQVHNPEVRRTGKVIPYHLKYCRQSSSSDHYIMSAPFETLPSGLGGAHSIQLYVPKNINPPKNPGHSEIYIFNKKASEFGFQDPEPEACETTEDFFKLAFCSDAELKQLASKVYEKFDRAKEEIKKNMTLPTDIDDLERGQDGWERSVKSCEGMSCIKQNYHQRICQRGYGPLQVKKFGNSEPFLSVYKERCCGEPP